MLLAQLLGRADGGSLHFLRRPETLNCFNLGGGVLAMSEDTISGGRCRPFKLLSPLPFSDFLTQKSRGDYLS